MNFTATDIVHLSLGLAAIAGVTVLAALKIIPGDEILPAYLTVLGISGATQIGSTGIRAAIARATPAMPAPGPGATNA